MSLADPDKAAALQSRSMLVAHPMNDRCAVLGLGSPLPLLGGGVRLSPGGMPLAPGIDHAVPVREHVIEACRRQSETLSDWYSQRPLALVGPAGAGRSLLVDWIARAAGVPLFRVDATHFKLPVDTSHVDERLCVPPFPAIAMAASRCANPVIAIDLGEGHELDGPSERCLASMINPVSNTRWVASDLDTIFDFSQISWIIMVGPQPSKNGIIRHDHASYRRKPAVPPILAEVMESYGRTVLVEWLREDAEQLRRLSVAAEACRSSRSGGGLPQSAVRALFEALLDLKQSQVDIETLRSIALRELESLRTGGR